KKDEEIYVDIRKKNEINIYHNGGSILKIDKKFNNAEINYAYLPAGKTDDTYAKCKINENEIVLAEKITIDLNNFSRDKISKIKKIIKNYYPNESEKGIQGAYATHWKKPESKESNGFFIDTEFAFPDEKSRIDLIFLNYKDTKQPKLYFVELKTKGDNRLFDIDIKSDTEPINKQLEKYCKLIEDNKVDLVRYYKTLYKIKKELKLMPEDARNIDIENLTIESKLIFLIGDATNAFIKKHATELNEKVKKYACMAIYRGIDSKHLNFDKKGIKAVYKF
ncbi:MAG: hypothetical protein LBJ21_04040, partial [Acidobacteriota bacterium]|nr:hypothetical protein [Acidobacteriota bacterium]